jgi:O-antigen/teichoic acid export membrane protein
MAGVGAGQALLLAPSLMLTVAGLSALTLADYGAWAILFALSSAAIVLDGGASQLAQIAGAHRTAGHREIMRLLGLAAVAPVLLTIVLGVAWTPLSEALLDPAATVEPLLGLVVGSASILRSWQNVGNSLLLGAGETRRRLFAAAASALVQVPFALAVTWWPDPLVLAAGYAAGAAVGLLALARATGAIGARPSGRGPYQVARRTSIGALSVALTQLDRLLVALFALPAGLAAYDLSARLAAAAKLACIMLSAGQVGEGARADRDARPDDVARTRAAVQRYVDRVAIGLFAAVPVAAWALAALTAPEIAAQATVLAAILSVGHGLHATTAPLTGFLSGRRRLGPELGYLAAAVGAMAALALLLGPWLGAQGIALAVSASLSGASLWLRARVRRAAGDGPRSSR